MMRSAGEKLFSLAELAAEEHDDVTELSEAELAEHIDLTYPVMDDSDASERVQAPKSSGSSLTRSRR